MTSGTYQHPLTTPSTAADLPFRTGAAGVVGITGESLLRRGAAAVGLLGIALIHLLDVPGKFGETPYLGVAYLGLIVTALFCAELLLRRDDRLVWAATGALAASTLIGYTLSRTTGLPGAMGDVGNWLEPLGLASLFVEGVVLLLAASALARSGARRDRLAG